jgi:hypothetical protein
MTDIFISYAHIDDRPLTEGQRGWVSQFHRILELRLAQLMGEDTKIWRDPKLAGNDVFDDTIIHQLPQARALVSVVSPRYVRSEWCTREIHEFWKAAEQNGGVRVQDKSRIFKVIKTPIQPDEIPVPLKKLFASLLGFEFFTIDPETGRLREYYDEFGPEAKRSYLEKVYDLAYEIFQLLKSFDPADAPQPMSATGKVVYLAETTSDLQGERNRLKRELLERGHTVLPDQPLPWEATELKKIIANDLNRAQVAIHLLGNRYGLIPEGSDCSIVELQTRLAAARCQGLEFCRFIWFPSEDKALDERQALFLKSVEEDSVGMVSTEVLGGTLEQLKSLVVKKLAVRIQVPMGIPAVEESVLRLYLICDQQDERAIEPIVDFLFAQGFEVNTPQFDGDDETFALAHQENLGFCDAAIIYYGQASGQWVEIKLMDLLKAPGYGRTKPMLAKAVLIAPPDNHRKDRFKTHTAEVIRMGPQFEPGVLEPLVTLLKATLPAPPDSR